MDTSSIMVRHSAHMVFAYVSFRRISRAVRERIFAVSTAWLWAKSWTRVSTIFPVTLL